MQVGDAPDRAPSKTPVGENLAMMADAPAYRVREIDPSDDRLLARFVELENAFGRGRERTVEERRSLLDIMVASRFLVAERGEEWVAVLNASTQEVDGGKSVHLHPTARPTHEAALPALADRIASWPAAASAEALAVHLQDPTDEELQAWSDAGFVPAGMRQSWRLGISGNTHVEVPSIPGVRVVSLADHLYLEPSAHEAWCDAYRAIPDELVNDAIPSFESWRAELIRDGGGTLPASLLVAVDVDDRVVGVGYLHIHQPASRSAGHRLTGVVSDWRGRGVARLLKAKQIEWAASNGISELRCSNNERNHAMLHINDQLGYERTSTIVMMRRAFHSPSP